MVSVEKIAFVAFLLIGVLLAMDLYDDVWHGADLSHVLLEGTAFLLAATMVSRAAMATVRSLRLSREVAVSRVHDLIGERDRWRARAQRYLLGLGEAIDEQFRSWNLTESEREVGLLILKGFSHKEIAGHRATSEQTVRQQAASIYAKAHVENKAQLSAFFLEDLMLPDRQLDELSVQETQSSGSLPGRD